MRSGKNENMLKKRIIYKTLITAALISVFISCTARQDINIDRSGKGSCTVRVELNSFFTDYLKDLSDAAGSSDNDFSVFEKQMIEEIFSKHSAAELADVRIKGSGSLEVDLKFNNPGDILNENKLNPVISYNRKGDLSILSFNLNLENYRALSSLTGLADNPVLAALTPQVENPYSHDEYLDMLDFVFSDYEGGEAAPLTVSKSMVEIDIETDGKIERAENGAVIGRKAVFRIPLLNFLTLSKPVVFSVEYR